MPTYQYSCTECGHFFEQFQSFSEESLTVCPKCQGRLRKVFNAVGVVFKGSGFYRTDSRADGGKAENRSASTGGSKDGGSGASDGASKPSAGSGEKAGSGASSTGAGSASGAAKTSSGSTSAA